MLTRFRQHPLEKLRYVIDMQHALADDETLSSVAVTQDDDLTLESVMVLPPDNTSYQFFASEGEDGGVYELVFVAETDQGQSFVSEVHIAVRGD